MIQWSLLYPVCEWSCEAVEDVCLYKEISVEVVVVSGENEDTFVSRNSFIE